MKISDKVLSEVIRLSDELEPVILDDDLDYEENQDAQQIIDEIISEDDFIEEEDSDIAELINNDPLFKELLEEK